MSITTNEIIIPKKIFKSTLEKDLDFDATLADFCPDIARLIRIDCTPFLENCNTDGDKTNIAGKVVYDVLYETDYKSKLKYCSFTQEFNHTVPLPKNAVNATAFCKIKCDRISCKLLSPRKFVIKTGLSLCLDIEGEKTVNAVAVTESNDIFFKKKIIGFDGRTNEISEVFRFDDLVQLSQNEKNIGEVIFGSITLQEPQTVLSPGHADIKTVASVKAICEDEDEEGKYFAVTKTLPLDMEFSSDVIEDYKEIELRLEPMNAEFKPELDQYGENRVIHTNFAVNLKLKYNEPKAYTVTNDLFEKGFDSVCVTGTATVPKVYAKEKTSFSAESKLAEMLPKPMTILDSTVKEGDVKIETAEDGIKITGGFPINILSETSEGIYSFDRNLPFEQFIRTEIPTTDFEPVADVRPVEIITTLHSDGSVTARVIATVNLEIRTTQEESFVTDVTKRIPKESKIDESTIIYRYPQQGEDVWDIAKSYGADPDSIINFNPEIFDENGNMQDSCKPIIIKI